MIHGTRTCHTVILVAVTMFVLAPVASAQLSDTQWQEATQVQRDNQSDVDAGAPFAPVNTSSSLQGVSATVAYPDTPSPPSVTSTVSGSANGDVVIAWAFASVTFQFQLNEIMAPVVSITSVPMSVTAMGTASATGTVEFSATARASLDLFSQMIGSLVMLEADGTSFFDETVAFAIDPDEVVTGVILASAQITTGDLGATDNASAEAFVDPIFVVSSDIIPGTSTRYDEVYEVEFSPGYWALGNPTPVEPSTWGRIKQLYTN